MTLDNYIKFTLNISGRWMTLDNNCECVSGTLVTIIREGVVIGDWGIMHDQPRSATIKAMCDCEMVKIGK